MCTILIAWRCLDDARYVVAANRDELVGRPSAGPGMLSEEPRIHGGRDLLAGGTWLAVRSDGALAAVTNRRSDAQDEVLRDPAMRSRGELPLLVLRDASGVQPAVENIDATVYNPFNLLVVDDASARVGHATGARRLRIAGLDPGLHVLCVHDVDDVAHRKEVRIRAALMDELGDVRDVALAVERMTALLGNHDSDDGEPRGAVCIHGDEYGTVSSSVLWEDASGGLHYMHAAGRPCTTPFLPVDMA